MEILACSACGGQVPLGDGDSVTCPFCNAQVTLPEAHRALRDAERKDAAARTKAAELFKRYGKRPSLPLRIAAVVFHPIFLILDGFFLLLLVSMLGVLSVIDLLSPLFHANLHDTIPDGPQGFGMFFIAAGSVLGGMALGIYGRRRIQSLKSLQATLAARPPTRAGESALCRECGAPLHVAGGAEGVRCAYCHADNLVDVPADWIGGIKADRARVGRAIEEAHAWLDAERRRIRTSMIQQLLIANAVLVGFVVLIIVNAKPNPGWRAGWSIWVKPPRPMVRLQRGWDRNQLAIGKCETIDVLHEECPGGNCRVWLYAALRAGEHFKMTGATAVRTLMHSHFWWTKDPDGFGREVGGAEFTAPWSAWYQLRVDFPEDKRELCASVE
jgi:LSD1 subclass zinc finger protein